MEAKFNRESFTYLGPNIYPSIPPNVQVRFLNKTYVNFGYIILFNNEQYEINKVKIGPVKQPIRK